MYNNLHTQGLFLNCSFMIKTSLLLLFLSMVGPPKIILYQKSYLDCYFEQDFQVSVFPYIQELVAECYGKNVINEITLSKQMKNTKYVKFLEYFKQY